MSFKKAEKLNARRTACLCLTAVMTASLAAGNALAFAQDGSKPLNRLTESYGSVSFEDITGKLDLTGVALQNLSPSVIENAGLGVVSSGTQTVIVTLDTDCVLESLPDGVTVSDYIEGYAGGKTLKKIKQSQTNFLNSLSSLGADYKLKYSYSSVTNAVAISVDTAYIPSIKTLPVVEAAFVSERYAYPEETTSSGNGAEDISKVYKTGIYDSSKYVEEGIDGSGMTVAVLDTGLDYTHEAFTKYMPSTLGFDKSDLAAKLKASDYNAVTLSASRGKAIDENDLYLSDKVPFAYDYADKDADVYPSYSQHGTHVAGIVAGHADSYKNKKGEVIEEPFYGVAPNAQLVICKVFTDNFESDDLGGATTEDLVAALDDCVTLGVDVINMSLGTTAGFSSQSLGGDDEGKELARIYSRIKDAGVSLICAASNDFSAGFGSAFGTNLTSNPDSGTVGSPSTFDGAMSVASINGQLSPYVLANGKDVIYFKESSNATGERYDFVKQLLGGNTSATFKYVTVDGFGEVSDYTPSVRRELADKTQGKTIAVVQRGSTSFQDKVQNAKDCGADAVIIDNNVSGTISMSLGDLVDPIPAISIPQESGRKLRYNENNRKTYTGVIEVNLGFQAGPFMNDYSSWGTTPDLQLKPDVTAHGGEITSTVAGGYDEMSGTSMATPNLAGFVALLRSKLKADFPALTAQELNRLVNQITMSTAIIVYDENGLPYSPRKQGSGLATLDNVFGTSAYLYTVEGENFGAEDNRPKVELGEDENKEGVYTVKFYLTNFGADTLEFKANSIFMTESVSLNGQAVAERAYLLNGSPVWKLNGAPLADGGTISVAAGDTATIECRLTLSAEDKLYLDGNFANGMFVEGFIQLVAVTQGQCNLTLPFMGFYGDWESSPMLDYDAYYLAEQQQDSSILDNMKPQARVWATQAYAPYYNKKYSVPLGSFAYVQDENAQQIYTEQEHSAISCWNIDNGEDATNNYMTANGIYALYAGLLRNAELVTYDLINAETGEVIKSECVYRVSKAYAGGGAAHPAQVKLDLYPEQLGLEANGKYRLDFSFYFREEDAADASKADAGNTFSMTFYVDYEAPILVDSRIRYRDYTDPSTNKVKQTVYLDLDVYDNHYAQSVILCYGDREDITSVAELKLVTDFVTPVYNANKNGTTTVSIDITDVYDKYKGNLYVQLDDYALNHSVYSLNISTSNGGNLPADFEIDGPEEVTIGVNEAYKIQLSYNGDANASNFTWDLDDYNILRIKNGEIFGVKAGDATVTVKGANGAKRQVKVHVIDKGLKLPTPTLSFGVIENWRESLQKASGTVKVNAGRTLQMELLADTWYYPVSEISALWSSSNTDVATVTQDGVVTTKNKRGTATITAVPVINGQVMADGYAARVTLAVQEPFVISNNSVTHYYGSEETVILPADKNIMTISSEAFKDNDTMKTLIISKTVTEIEEKAFINCTALENIYFISDEKLPVPDSSLANIRKRAFEGCVSLKLLDLSNVKTITVDNRAFLNCTSLEEIVNMKAIGTMYYSAFENCTSLKSADLTGLHVSGGAVFRGCTGLDTVETAYYTAIGEQMFAGCKSLKSIVISTPNVAAGAFANSGLQSVTFDNAAGDTRALEFTVGAQAFLNCTALTDVDFKNHTVLYLGDGAFANCENLAQLKNYVSAQSTGIKVFAGTKIASADDADAYGAIYSGTTLVSAADVTAASYTVKSGTTAIAPYAFANSAVTSLNIPASVTQIGAGAFMLSGITEITLAGAVTEIPAEAFAGSKLASITIPASVTQIGAAAFADCVDLKTVAFTSGRAESLSIGYGAFAGCAALERISLPEISGGELAAYAFAGCAALETADLNNVTVIGAYAFANCLNLNSVAGIDAAVSFGDYSFMNAVSLEMLNLASAKTVGRGAFMLTVSGGYNTVLFPSAETIGDAAFRGGKENKITVPATLKTLGAGAFAASPNLESIEVEEGNKKFFTVVNVLYRLISGEVGDGEYELCCYPAAAISPLIQGVSTYEIVEGTVSVQGYAFYGLNANAVKAVVFPYSIKTVGSGAFLDSYVTQYRFNCINAPTLYAEPYDNGITAFNSLYYTNFGDRMLYHTNNVTLPQGFTVAELIITYPSNGVGYDNYVFENYFGTKIVSAEIMDDVTRLAKTLIEGFISVEKVKEWNTLAVTEDNKKLVTDFSEEVKRAHGVLNTVLSATQRGFLGEENIKKLADIEAELKPVKARFGISVYVDSIEVAEGSSYKREYRVGERFDKTGLVLLVIYDDYSEEIISDASEITLTADYAEELTVLNGYVVVEYGGATVQVEIHVSDENGGKASSSGKLNPAVIYGPILGVVAAAGIAVGAFFLVKKLKKGKGAKAGEDAESVQPEAETENKDKTNKTDEEE